MDAAALARFLGKIEVNDVTGCWSWQGATSRGYAQLVESGKVRSAHRLSFEHYNHDIPSNLQVDHLCRNRACVNPDHLELVTAQQNIRRGHEARGWKLDPHKSDILAMRAAGMSYMRIARTYGVSDATVFDSVRKWESE